MLIEGNKLSENKTCGESRVVKYDGTYASETYTCIRILEKAKEDSLNSKIYCTVKYREYGDGDVFIIEEEKSISDFQKVNSELSFYELTWQQLGALLPPGKKINFVIDSQNNLFVFIVMTASAAIASELIDYTVKVDSDLIPIQFNNSIYLPEKLYMKNYTLSSEGLQSSLSDKFFTNDPIQLQTSAVKLSRADFSQNIVGPKSLNNNGDIELDTEEIINSHFSMKKGLDYTSLLEVQVQIFENQKKPNINYFSLNPGEYTNLQTLEINEFDWGTTNDPSLWEYMNALSFEISEEGFIKKITSNLTSSFAKDIRIKIVYDLYDARIDRCTVNADYITHNGEIVNPGEEKVFSIGNYKYIVIYRDSRYVYFNFDVDGINYPASKKNYEIIPYNNKPVFFEVESPVSFNKLLKIKTTKISSDKDFITYDILVWSETSDMQLYKKDVDRHVGDLLIAILDND